LWWLKHVGMLEGDTTVEEDRQTDRQTDRQRGRRVSICRHTVCAYLFIGDLLVTGE